jgi:ParB family chromosome partitioning protein
VALNCEYAELLVDSIYYDRTFNCRGEFTPQSCLDISQSIKEHGLQIPIVVQPAEDVENGMPAGYAYRLIAGHRRYIAVTQLLNQDVIPAQIRKGLSEQQARILNLIENLERKDITLLDEAKALRNIFPEGTSYSEMTKATSKSSFWCRVRWLLTTLDEEIQQDCAAGRLSTIDISMILAADDIHQLALARELKMAKGRGESVRKRRSKFSRGKMAKKRLVILEMLANLMCQRIELSPYRALAWAAGDLTDEELLNEN